MLSFFFQDDPGACGLDTTLQHDSHNISSASTSRNTSKSRLEVENVKRQLWKIRAFKDTGESAKKILIKLTDEPKLMKTENDGCEESKNSVDMNESSESESAKDVKDTLLTDDSRQPKTEVESKNNISHTSYQISTTASKKRVRRRSSVSKHRVTFEKIGTFNALPTSQATKDKAFTRPIQLMLDPLTSRNLNFCTMRVSWRPSGSQLEETWEEITNLHDKADSVVASNHQVTCYISSLNGTYTRPTTGHTIKSRPDVYPMISYLIAHSEKHFDVESLQDQLMRTLPNCHAAPIRRMPTVHKSQLEPAIRLICKDHKNSFINTMVSQSLESCAARAANIWKVTHLGVVDGSLAEDMKPAEKAFESLNISTHYHSTRIHYPREKSKKGKPKGVTKSAPGLRRLLSGEETNEDPLDLSASKLVSKHGETMLENHNTVPVNCQLLLECRSVADAVSSLNPSMSENVTKGVNGDDASETPHDVVLTPTSLTHELNTSHGEQDIKGMTVDDKWENMLPRAEVVLTPISLPCEQSPVAATPNLDEINRVSTPNLNSDISPPDNNQSPKAESDTRSVESPEATDGGEVTCGPNAPSSIANKDTASDLNVSKSSKVKAKKDRHNKRKPRKIKPLKTSPPRLDGTGHQGTRKSPRNKVVKTYSKTLSRSKPNSASPSKRGKKTQTGCTSPVSVGTMNNSVSTVKMRDSSPADQDDSTSASAMKGSPTVVAETKAKKRKRLSSNEKRTESDKAQSSIKQSRISKKKKRKLSSKDCTQAGKPSTVSAKENLDVSSQPDQMEARPTVLVRTRIVSQSSYSRQKIRRKGSKCRRKSLNKDTEIMTPDISNVDSRKSTCTTKSDFHTDVLSEFNPPSDVPNKSPQEISLRLGSPEKACYLWKSAKTQQTVTQKTSPRLDVVEQYLLYKQKVTSTPAKQTSPKIIGTCTPVKVLSSFHEVSSISSASQKIIAQDMLCSGPTTEGSSQGLTTPRKSPDNDEYKTVTECSPTKPARGAFHKVTLTTSNPSTQIDMSSPPADTVDLKGNDGIISSNQNAPAGNILNRDKMRTSELPNPNPADCDTGNISHGDKNKNVSDVAPDHVKKRRLSVDICERELDVCQSPTDPKTVVDSSNMNISCGAARARRNVKWPGLSEIVDMLSPVKNTLAYVQNPDNYFSPDKSMTDDEHEVNVDFEFKFDDSNSQNTHLVENNSKVQTPVRGMHGIDVQLHQDCDTSEPTLSGHPNENSEITSVRTMERRNSSSLVDETEDKDIIITFSDDDDCSLSQESGELHKDPEPIDGLVKDCGSDIADTTELPQPCAKPEHKETYEEQSESSNLLWDDSLMPVAPTNIPQACAKPEHMETCEEQSESSNLLWDDSVMPVASTSVASSPRQDIGESLTSHVPVGEDRDSTTTFSGPEESFSHGPQVLDSYEDTDDLNPCKELTHDDNKPGLEDSERIQSPTNEAENSAEDIFHNCEPDGSVSEFSFQSDSSDHEVSGNDYQDSDTDWCIGYLNTLAPGRFGCDFKNSIFKLVLLIGILRSLYDNGLRWMPQNITDDKSTLVQVMAWCHYLSQC